MRLLELQVQLEWRELLERQEWQVRPVRQVRLELLGHLLESQFLSRLECLVPEAIIADSNS